MRQVRKVSPSLQGQAAFEQGKTSKRWLGSLKTTSPRVGRADRSRAGRHAPYIKLSFNIPGPLLGYRASAARAHDPRYKAYKEAVRLYALAAGWARVDPGPGHHPRLNVSINWRAKARIDWTNVVKAIEDALWAQDRDTEPGMFEVRRNMGAEYARVEVWWS